MLKKMDSRQVSLAAIVGAIYASLTIVLQPISFSWIQLRISESLTPIPFILGGPSVIGLFIGCFIANLFSPIGLLDMIFGPLLTLIAAIFSWKLNFNRKWLACLYPIVINAFGVSVYISLLYNIPYFISVISIGLGEGIVVGIIGYPLLVALERTGLFLIVEND